MLSFWTTNLAVVFGVYWLVILVNTHTHIYINEHTHVSVCVCVCVCVAQSCPILCNSMECDLSGSMEFSRQEYWVWEPFPSPGDLPQGLNLHLLHILHCILYHLSYQGSPEKNRERGFKILLKFYKLEIILYNKFE